MGKKATPRDPQWPDFPPAIAMKMDSWAQYAYVVAACEVEAKRVGRPKPLGVSTLLREGGLAGVEKIHGQTLDQWIESHRDYLVAFADRERARRR